MKVGDLVKMDFIDWTDKDQWGPGIVVCIENNGYDTDEVEVLWSKLGLGWEMSSMLEVISEDR